MIQEAPAGGRVSCLQCAKCCTYVAVGINAPTTPKLATEILWHLYHENVSVCRDEAGEWYVQFPSRCKNLGVGNLCAIYENRPHLCRDYSDETCEINAPQAGLIEFTEPRRFLEYLRVKRPRIYKTIEGKYVPLAHLPAPAEAAPAGPKAKRASARVR